MSASHIRRPGAGADTSTAARSSVVNRTHRVVRAQAVTLREQRSRSRSLWVPVALCSTLLIVVCYAVWSMLDGYDSAEGIVDASDQLFIFLLWLLPASALLFSYIWSQRSRKDAGFNEVSS